MTRIEKGHCPKAKPIVLVNPPFNKQWGDYPLGLLYIAAVLERDGHEVKVVDLNFESSWENYRRQIEAVDFDIIGFTSLSLYASEAFKAIRIAKEAKPNCTVILGGAHATAVPEECMKEDLVNYIVYGEGEATVCELVKVLLAGGDVESVRGIYLRKGGKVCFTGPRPFIEDLDSLPLPARHLLPDIQRYFDMSGGGHATVMMASRGCPGNCAYCQPMLRSLFGRKVRTRSPQNVAAEIDWLVRTYGVSTISFRDDTICARKGWLREFADLMRRRAVPARWWGSARVDDLTEETVDALARAGCVAITAGVESGTQRVLNILRKGVRVEDVKPAADLCKKHGILFVMAVMIGNPGETREEILQTIRHVKEIDPDILDPHITTATPGSQLYYDGIREGYLKAYDPACLTDREKISYNFSKVSDKDLRELLHLLWREYRLSRHATRAYCRWRLESIFRELQRLHFASAARLFGLSVVKGNGRAYWLARALWKAAFPVVQFSLRINEEPAKEAGGRA